MDATSTADSNASSARPRSDFETRDAHTARESLEALERLGRPRVLVLGDLILDRYTWGNAERVSQEAPVILLRADHREARLGGAANVCNLLRGLECPVACAGVVGRDAEGELIREKLLAAGANADFTLVDESRPSTVKERFIGRAQGRHPHQMLRVDSETRDPLSPALERDLAERVHGRLTEFDLILISDYDKGVCTPSLLKKIIEAARARNIPLLVDPIRSRDYSRYRGATSMTPNRLEAGMASGVEIRDTEDALRAARILRRELDLDYSIVTLDRDGMALVDAAGNGEILPTRPRAVYDITGAGDMALAMIGVCLAGGLAPAEAVRLGNVAAGLEVEKIGVAVIERAEIRQRLIEESRVAETRQFSKSKPLPKVVSRDEIEKIAEERRRSGQSIVFTNGCFDLLHVGHVTYLAESRALGDLLVVGLNSDASARRLKGPTRPVIGEYDRAKMLAALASVDYVVIFDEETPLELIRRVRPNVLVKGGSYDPATIVGREIVEAAGGKVLVTAMVDGVSTTRILERLSTPETVAPTPFSPGPTRLPTAA